ncbi:TIGR00266 family protein [Synergistales bacterium]|nr:TIGR00266 family protein [Synergistales bacterium]
MKSAAGIEYEILYKGAFSMVCARLRQGQSLKAQSDAMVTMDVTMDVEGKMEGGIVGGLGRLFLSGENFFFQTLKAARGDGEVLLASASPGDVEALEIEETPYLLQKGGFLAATEGVEINTKMQNLAKGMFSGAGFFVLEVSGRGLLFAESFGAIHTVDIPAGKEIIIDNQHLVAWPQNVKFTLEKASAKGWMSSVTSGEGLVCRFQGPGKVLIQTRNPGGFGEWVKSLLPQK